MSTELVPLIKKEGWKVVNVDVTDEITGKTHKEQRIEAYGDLFPITHPFAIHGKLYRESENPEIKYMHFKAMHDYMWPDTIWHYWTERRFREHCAGWNFITYAGGASCAKSSDAAKIALLFYWANPKERAVVIASTSLESLSTRIWGYVIKHLNSCALYLPALQLGGQSPKVLYDYKVEGRKTRDNIHGMFAVAAKTGDDEKVISSWIGRHPDDAIMLVLDEATDMPPALLKALPNLEQGVNFFQCMAIGNSNSRFDLHGGMSTPKDGWSSVDPKKDNKWLTTQKNGICLFFSCFESPAIHESDPEKKKILSKFLITEKQIQDKEMLYGKDSESFWRFVVGFWKSDSVDEVVISRKFISDFDVFAPTEWSGLYPISMVAGLDPAFSTGGDNCLLRLALLGVDVNGKVVLDFKDTELLFPIKIMVKDESADLQIAREVVRKLLEYDIPLNHLAIDATGQGRALGGVIKLMAASLVSPISICSVRGANQPKHAFDLIIKNNHELWFAFREFIQNRQIRGLDHGAAAQFTTRLIVNKGGRQFLETKRDYKTRMSTISPQMAHSPDEADCASLCLQSAIINYGFTPGQERDVKRVFNFADDKYNAYKQMHRGVMGNGEDSAGGMGRSPVATFENDLTSYISHKDKLSNY